MRYTTPQSLLALPATASSPSAYQILGLPDFEPDRTRIRSAGELLAAKLAELQSQADGEAWEQANKWLRSATTILSDASKKSAYDRKLLASRPAVAVDPLAGMLPGRIAAAAPASVGSTPSSFGSAPSSFGSPPGVSTLPGAMPPSAINPMAPPAIPTPTVPSIPNGSGSIDGSDAAVATPVIKRRVTTARKKGLPVMPVVMSVFCLGCIGVLAYVVYAMVNGDQKISLNINRGPAVNVVDPNGDGRAVVVPGEVGDRSRVPFDPVMGGLGKDARPTAPPIEVNENNQSNMSPPTATPTGMNNNMAATDGMNATDPASPDMMMPETPKPDMTSTMPEVVPATPPVPSPTTPPVPAPTTPTVPEPTTTPVPEPTAPAPETPAPPTPEELKAADMAIAAVREAALKHQWDRLKPLAETAEMSAKSPEQKAIAEGLFQLTDLATYYRDGIYKTMQTLQSGQEIDLKEGFKFVIVEINAQQLVIRLNGANKSYRLDALPAPLVSRFGEMAMPDDSATSRAAKYAYQSLAESTNAPFRQKAVQELSQIDGEIEGAEVEKLVNAIRFLYPQ